MTQNRCPHDHLRGTCPHCSGWAPLRAAVDDVVKTYRTDLEHDRNAIDAAPDGTPFLHFAGETGTTMVMLTAADLPPKDQRVPYLFGTANRDHILRGMVDRARYEVERSPDWHPVIHYWTGRTLRAIDGARALAIARDFEHRTRADWARDERPAGWAPSSHVSRPRIG
jgi:hypothetical protein